MPGRGMALRDALVNQANSLIANNPYVPFGAGARQAAQGHRAAKRNPEGAVPFSITGKSAPEHFTHDELYDIANNPELAGQIYKEYTGKRPSQEDIDGLLSRIQETFPEITQQRRRSETIKESFQKAQEAMNRGNNPDLKPMVDFFANNPEIATYGGRGQPADNSLFEAAQRIKNSGYTAVNAPQQQGFGRRMGDTPPDPGIEAIKQGAVLYALPREQGGYNTFLENIDKNPHEIMDEQDRADVQRISPAIRQRAQQQTQSREQALPLRMREASRLEKLASTAEKGADRIAPLNEVHEQAKQLLQRNLNPQRLEEATAKARNAGNLDVEAATLPYLNQATQGPDDFIGRHKNRYQGVIEAFREEAAKDLADDIPKINRQFASKGAFYSGAREAAIRKDIAEKEKMVAREAARLMSHGEDEAMKHYHQDRKHTLDAAQVAGKARGANQDAALRAAEVLRTHALSAKDATHKDAAALANIARTEQQQAQNALNVRMAEHKEQQERPWVELERKSAIAAGHPLQPVQYSPDILNPAPPNVYGMGAGMLGQITGLSKLQGQYRKGGHVRSKYADGGSIARTAAELKQMEQHTNQPNEYEQQMLSEGQALKNSHIDPMGRYLFTLGSHMIANNRKDPLQMYGEGSMRGMEAHDNANAHNISSKEKYVNLLNKINESRKTQQQHFSQYHLNKMNQEQALRAHNESLAETRRHHDLMHQRELAKIQGMASTNPNLPSFPSKEAEKAFYKREGKLKENFDEQVENSQRDVLSINKMENLFSKGIGDTGTVIGRVPEALLKPFYSAETIANRRLFEKEYTTKVLDIMNRAKGNQTDSDREYMARTTVSLKDDPVTIKNYLRDLSKVTKRNAEAVKFIEQEMEEGVPIDQAQKQWRKYVDANPLFAREEGNAPAEQNSTPTAPVSEGGGLVKMISPEGAEWAIPKEKVQDAINDGARVL